MKNKKLETVHTSHEKYVFVFLCMHVKYVLTI